MKSVRSELARKALLTALTLRRRAGKKLSEPICIYDFVANHGIEVQFLKISSMEGFYSKDPGPLILISSERPPGRQVFTCAHEFGHHIFGHGTRADKLVTFMHSSRPEEYLVDCFAGFLLMPKSAVVNAFTKRGWNPNSPQAIQLYTIAGYFGVGVSTLVHHMGSSLGLLDASTTEKLLKIQPKLIREEILGVDLSRNLIVADIFWAGRPIDIEVGDILHAPDTTGFEGVCGRFSKHIKTGTIFEAVAPGLGRLNHNASGWTAYVRVSRREFEGRSIYRHLEETDCE